MSVTLTRLPDARRALDPRTGAQVLARACASGTTIRLRHSDDDLDIELVGKLVGGDEHTATIHFNADTRGKLTNVVYSAEFSLTGERYVLEGRCVPDANDESGDVLLLIEPETLAVVERRRSKRRRLAPSSAVYIDGGDDADPWRCAAVMLNVSLNGLACRVERECAERIREGLTLDVAFEIGPESRRIELHGRVVSVMGAGSPDCSLVGIAFEEDGAYAIAVDDLARALECGRSAGGPA